MTATEAAFKQQLLERAQTAKSSLVEWRRAIHSHPELSFFEVATSQLVADSLTKMGFTVTKGIAGTGLIAEMGSGKTIIVRADLDALPIEEHPGTEYSSRNAGVMHACGHDAHVALSLIHI